MRRILFVSPFMLLGGWLVAQPQTQGGFVSSLEVRVVNVEVTVTAADGQPVDDLQPEEFEIFEDGELQGISNFFRIRGGVAQLDDALRGGAPVGKTSAFGGAWWW